MGAHDVASIGAQRSQRLASNNEPEKTESYEALWNPPEHVRWDWRAFGAFLQNEHTK